jgi:hypothetical protein
MRESETAFRLFAKPFAAMGYNDAGRELSLSAIFGVHPQFTISRRENELPGNNPLRIEGYKFSKSRFG